MKELTVSDLLLKLQETLDDYGDLPVVLPQPTLCLLPCVGVAPTHLMEFGNEDGVKLVLEMLIKDTK